MTEKENEPVNEEIQETNPEETTEETTQLEQPVNSKDESIQAKYDELNDKYLRLFAEYENYRKRTAKERIELIKAAGEDVFKSFLPVIDDLERAIKLSKDAKDIKAVNEGIDLIYSKLKHNLTQKGLEPYDSMGKEFNTDLHEAITNVPATSDEMKGKVVDELEKGYMLHGKVIRFAKVVIGA
ncbi:MAG TPA: nucleotide exchange factor GrpE [Bacteroidia bacterium]|nr:nucleotide exchange factor GrpE [Bacteroidia bacterium]